MPGRVDPLTHLWVHQCSVYLGRAQRTWSVRHRPDSVNSHNECRQKP